MNFSNVLLEDIYQKVRKDGVNAMDAVRAFGEAWGYNRRERFELFEAYAEYSMSKQVK